MPKTYPTETIERGLHLMALEAGSAGAAHRQLKAERISVPERTLIHWRLQTHAARYEQIRQQLADRLDQDLAEDMAQLARQRVGLLSQIGDRTKAALDTEAQANQERASWLLKAYEEAIREERPEDAQELRQERDDLLRRTDSAVKELAAADRNLTTSLGILSQNNRVIRDKPTAIHKHEYSIDDLNAAIDVLREIETIDSTAEPIEDKDETAELSAASTG